MSVSYKYLVGILVVCGFVAAASIFRPGKKDHPDLPETIDFNFHIKPILSSQCFTCHGPDPESRKAGLRLDTYEGASLLLESGFQAIVPHKPDKSELLRRVRESDPEKVMPPPESKKSLSAYQKALLEAWIRQGAEYAPHWSFIPPQAKSPEAIRLQYFQELTHPIDRFVARQWEQQGLQPSPSASKEQLIRRIAFVLTGLPPHPDHVQAFLADTSLQAYEKWVNHYLDSPLYGERWARHWMDIVRYAETRGHEFDYQIKGAWRYRDYLIRAFNQDLPYDQLVREHFAGDLMTPPRLHPTEGYNESVIGPSFFVLGEGKHSPVDIKEEEAYRIENIIDVSSKAFMGMTVACARCHDHKFDPIPTRDYYAMYGMFKSMRFAPLPAELTPERQKALKDLASLNRAMRSTLGASWLDQAEEQNFVIQSSLSSPSATHSRPKVPLTVIGDFRKGDVDGWLVDGPAFASDPAPGVIDLDTTRLRVKGLLSARVSSRQSGPGIQGALRSPTFEITGDTIEVVAAGKHASIRVIVDNFQLIQWPIWGDLMKEVDSDLLQTYRLEVSKLRGHEAYIELVPGIYTRHEHHILPDSYIEAAYAIMYTDSLGGDHVPPMPTVNPPASLTAAIQAWMANSASPADLEWINTALRQGQLSSRLSPKMKALWEQRQGLLKKAYDPSSFEGIVAGSKSYSPVFIRGDHRKPDSVEVVHQFLTALSDASARLDPQKNPRKAFADRMLAPENPLTSRVMVNRLWHHVFGTGIVETVDNFGIQGKLPTHPQLLDWLAVEFQRNGWSVKKMLRLMLTSETFRLSVTPTEKARQMDPNNRFLSHYPVRRLEAEAIRDAMLAVSGCLDSTQFGTPIPVHLTPFMNGRGKPPKSGPLDGGGRRSVYLSVRRNFLSPMMLTFDMPLPATSFGQRNITNVPAQSLTLMNDPFVAEQAMMWARRLMDRHPTDPEARIREVYQTAFTRAPSPKEMEQAIEFFAQGSEEIPSLTDPCEIEEAQWEAYCHAVFNMKAFIYLL